MGYRLDWRRLVAVALLVALVIHRGGGVQAEIHEKQQGGEAIVKQEVEDKLADFNRVVQGDAFRAFTHPKTGVVFNVELNMSQASAQVVRLRTGSLRRRGFTFNEFSIPPGSVPVGVYPVRIVLVYRSFTAELYRLVNFTLVSPVLGVKVYDAFNLSTTEAVPELDFRTSAFSNVTVQITSRNSPPGVTPLCAAFDKDGNGSTFSSSPSSSAGGFSCSANHLGDFALVVPTSEIAPAPAPAPSASTQPPAAPRRRKKKSNKWKIILASVLGGLVALALLVLLVFLLTRVFRRSKMAKMEKQSERGEMLQTSLIGSSRAPTAGVARTKPVLESDYAA